MRKPKHDRAAVAKCLRDLERLFRPAKGKAVAPGRAMTASENQLSEMNPTGNERPEQAGQE